MAEFAIPADRLRPGTRQLRRAVFAKAGRDRVFKIESYLLHRHDLEMAKAALVLLLDEHWPPSDAAMRESVRETVMHGALVSYCRQFSSKARSCLDSKVTLRDLPDEARASHDYWDGIRNGHVAHDSNRWRDAITLVEVDDRGLGLGSYLLMVQAPIATADSVRNLCRLVEHTLSWVIAKSERLEIDLHHVIVALTREEIERMPVHAWTAPSAHESGDDRRR